MNSSMKELWGSSHISSGHAAYLESLYEVFLNNPKELTEDWREFFSNLSEGDLSKDISHKKSLIDLKTYHVLLNLYQRIHFLLMKDKEK